MKIILIAFIALMVCNQRSQAQRLFNYKIDQQDYKLDEKVLNDLFGNSFSDIVGRNWTDNDHFDLWAKSFVDWKEATVHGIWSWDTYGDRVANSSFLGGISPEYLGWKASGKSASGNPNKKNNVARRMQLLNTAISRQIIYYFTHKAIIN